MWQDALTNACVISTDATSGMVQPEPRKDGVSQACRKGTSSPPRLRQAAVRRLQGHLQCDASNVYDILEGGPAEDAEDGVTLLGCWAHCRPHFFEAATCRYAIMQGLMRIRAIHAVEDAFGKVPPAKRKLLREQHLRR
jgi:hypothetical protein